MFTLISAAAKLPNQTPQPPAGPQKQLVVEAQVHAATHAHADEIDRSDDRTRTSESSPNHEIVSQSILESPADKYGRIVGSDASRGSPVPGPSRTSPRKSPTKPVQQRPVSSSDEFLLPTPATAEKDLSTNPKRKGGKFRAVRPLFNANDFEASFVDEAAERQTRMMEAAREIGAVAVARTPNGTFQLLASSLYNRLSTLRSFSRAFLC